MPISDPQLFEIQKMQLTFSDTNGVLVNADVSQPTDGNALPEEVIRAFYQKVVNVLQDSPEFTAVSGSIITQRYSVVTAD